MPRWPSRAGCWSTPGSGCTARRSPLGGGASRPGSESWPRRWSIDPTWALAEERSSRPGSAADHRRYYLGAGLTLGVGWATMVTAGMVVGHRFGGAFGLDLAVPLCLVAMIGPRLGRRSDASVVATAGLVAAMTAGWTPGAGLLLAIGAGIAVGGLTDRGRR